MPPNQPRRHHYLPQSYLAGFTDSGTREGRLYVLSYEDGRRWEGTPDKIGHQRDFYRLDGVEGEDAFALERAFNDIEDPAAAAIRHIAETGRLPEDDEQFSYLINFIALMSARVPQTRANVARPLKRMWEMLLQIELSSRERFEAIVEHARRAGEQIPSVDYEDVKRAFEQEKVILEVSQAQHLDTLLNIADTLVPLLGMRHWVLMRATGAEFFVSDHPVSLVWTVPRPPSIYGPGFGIQGTDVTFPLTKTIALLGRLEPQERDSIALDLRGVASINSRTGMYAGRFVCSSNGEFVWETAANAIAGADELIQQIREHPRQPIDNTCNASGQT